MAPIEIQSVLQYSSVYFPGLTHPVDHHLALTHIGLFCAVLLMVFLCLINIISYSFLAKTNFLMTMFKVGVILIVVVVFATVHFHPQNIGLDSMAHFAPMGWHGIFAAIASGGIAFAFTGFRHGIELAAEAKNPKVALPLAIIGSIVCCAVLYILLEVVFIGVLSPHELAHGWQSLHFAGDAGPFIGITLLLGMAWLVNLVYLNTIISPMGAALVYVTSTARVLFAMSETRALPQGLQRLNKHSIPIWCIVINGVVGLLLFIPFSGWQAMTSFLVSSVVISYGMGPISVLAFRRQIPHSPRSFKLPFAELTAMLAFYCCNLIAYWSGWHILSKLIIAIVFGLLVYISYQTTLKRKGSGQTQLHLMQAWWLLPYLGGLSLISYFGSFGGGRGLLSFGVDFAVIAVFSVAILWLAVRCRLPSFDGLQ